MHIDHIGIYVNDLEGVRAFFQQHFGATAGAQYHNPRTGLRSYFLSLDGGARIEIMSRPEVGEPDARAIRHGIIHLALSVGSAETVNRITQQLRDAGCEVMSGPRTTGDGYYESLVMGPEHIQLEITV